MISTPYLISDLIKYFFKLYCAKIFNSLLNMLLISVVLLCYFQGSGITGMEFSERILDGKYASEHMCPYQVSIQSKNGIHFCGGAIINDKYILTAAHCLYSNNYKRIFEPDEVKIWAGGINLKSATKNVAVKDIERIIIHEEFEKMSLDNDIALLKTKTKYKYNKNIQPITLSTAYQENLTCVMSGWGQTEKYISNTSSQLKYTVITMTQLNDCQEAYKFANITEKVICAGENNTDSCRGDSGGPLVCNDKLEGIISFGYGCEGPPHWGVYTRVYNYLDWIYKQQQERSGISNWVFKYKNFMIFSWLCIIFIT